MDEVVGFVFGFIILVLCVWGVGWGWSSTAVTFQNLFVVVFTHPPTYSPNPLFNMNNYLSTPLKIKIDVPNVVSPCVSQLFVNFGP